MAYTPPLSTTPEQLNLDLKVAAEKEVDGVQMGVLSDGTPYLTIRGLARMCGVDHTMIVRTTAAWQDDALKPRELKIRELVRAQGADDSIAFIATIKDGTVHHAIPAAVCMAILEYYAFEARISGSEHAARSYRTLARKGFTDFIYGQVGYNPAGAPSLAWQHFHDRVTLSYHTVPDGYFSVFKEIADMFVTLIRKGAALGPTFVPDISVGQAWGRHWTSQNLDVVYGARLRYEHNYPAYFPQSASNPQTPYCYPDDALTEFRDWVRKTYLKHNLPKYLNSKVRQGEITGPSALAAIEAFIPTRPTAIR